MKKIAEVQIGRPDGRRWCREEILADGDAYYSLTLEREGYFAKPRTTLEQVDADYLLEWAHIHFVRHVPDVWDLAI